MPTKVPQKILEIVEDLAKEGQAPLTRLTSIKPWFDDPRRLVAFGLWIARRAAAGKARPKDEAAPLLAEARALLGKASGPESAFDRIDPRAAESLLKRAREFQNEHEGSGWGRVRVIKSWPLLLVEKGLTLHLGWVKSPSDGYDLAADWAKNHDHTCAHALNGPSRGRLLELVAFMFQVEEREEAKPRK